MADLHNKANITEFINVTVDGNYFGRGIKTICAEKIANALKTKLNGTGLEKCPLIGSFCGVANLNQLWDYMPLMKKAKMIYE